jgi:hypothetical protein
VSGFRQVVEEAVPDRWVVGEGGEGPEGGQREPGEEFGEGVTLEGRGTHLKVLGYEPIERRHCFDGGTLGAGEGEAAGEAGRLGFGKLPGEHGPVGGAGAGRVKLAQAGEGFGVLAGEAEGGVDVA